MSGDERLHCILYLISLFFFSSPFFFFLFITSLFSSPSLYPAFPPFFLSWNCWYQEILSHHGQFACLPGWKPQPCITGSHRRGHGQHVGTANCRAKLDPSVVLPPPRNKFQPLSISAPSSNLAHSSAAISPLQVIILQGKGFDQTVQTLRGCGEANTSRPDWWKFLRFQYVCAQWLCNSTLAIHFKKCSVYTGAFTLAFSAALSVLRCLH